MCNSLIKSTHTHTLICFYQAKGFKAYGLKMYLYNMRIVVFFHVWSLITLCQKNAATGAVTYVLAACKVCETD